MKNLLATISFLLLVCFISTPLAAQSVPRNTQDDRAIVEQRIDELIRQMSLEEKAGQLTLIEPFSRDAATIERLLADGMVGAASPSINGPEETRRWQQIAFEKSRLHIPILVGLDVIHGHRTIFPVPLALAGSFDLPLISDLTRMAASEAKLEGINLVFAPMVDVSRDARWGRIVESPGEDPYLASQIARAYVAGFQGKDLRDANSVATSVKHFAAYGAAESGRDYNSVDISERTLKSVYFPPFHAAVQAGSAAVLSAFNTINGVPVTANHYILTDVLRNQWGFRGFVLSDAGAVAELMKHGVALNESDATKKAVNAGLDMDLGGNTFPKELPALVRSGQLLESVLDEAVRRVLRVKFAMDLFAHPYPSDQAKRYAAEEKLSLARKAVHESVVLLKNSPLASNKPVLPIASNETKVALIGPFADAADQMMGPWAVVGSSKDVITLRTSLAERVAANGGKLLYARGCEIFNESERMHASPSIGEFIGKPEPTVPASERLHGQAGFKAALNAANQSDVVVMALGEDRTMSGEAGSRAHLDLPGEQQNLLEAVAATGKPIVLILFTGRPLALPRAAEHIPAILEAWYPGDQAGPGLVDVLFGNVNPSGHLAASFPRSVGQEPLYYNRLNTGRPADGVDLTHPPRQMSERWFSRYIDEQNSALFPFGWGLSYTTYTFGDVHVSRLIVPIGDLSPNTKNVITVAANVTNAGQVEGDVVVQLYVGVTGASVAMPTRELKGFQRLHLRASETKQVEFPLGFEELSFFDADSKQVVEPVHYQVWIGDSSLASESLTFETR